MIIWEFIKAFLEIDKYTAGYRAGQLDTLKAIKLQIKKFEEEAKSGK
jgi:hypothetical protein